jgi:hypothetical protein
VLAPISSASATSWSTNIRTPTVVQYLWLRLLAQERKQHLRGGRRRPEHLFMARRGSRQHPALRKGFSRREDDPAGAELPLHAPYPRRRLGPDREATAEPARQDLVDRGERRRQGPRPSACGTARRRRAASARRSSGWSAKAQPLIVDRHPRARAVPDPRVRGPLHPDRPALPHRRRLPFLRARRNPRRARLSAPVAQPADDLAFERIVQLPKRGLGDKALEKLHRHARAARRAARRGGSRSSTPTNLPPRARNALLAI